jgi:hypothetical protein
MKKKEKEKEKERMREKGKGEEEGEKWWGFSFSGPSKNVSTGKVPGWPADGPAKSGYSLCTAQADVFMHHICTT